MPTSIATAPPGQPPARPRVALCEPDPLLSALLGEWLQRAGYEPVRASAAQLPPDVALVVADVAAPRRRGGSCVAGLRQSCPRAKVLAISAQLIPGARGATTSAAQQLGADALLAKPFGAQAFVEAVRALLPA